MASDIKSSGIASGRLSAAEYEANFSDLHAPLTTHEAYVEADRCYFCYDAPCVTACPTGIDIPKFIRQIQTGNPLGSAKTIFEQNILGGMCARVCPTETLCEEVCVREEAEGKPVKIGQLQRYATDHFMQDREQPFVRGKETSKKVAVIGAGPAGLSCAHRLASYGHEVVIFEAAEKPGGLSEYGIAAYKTVDDFAQVEVDFVLSIGGISIEKGKKLGADFGLDEIRADFDAVFLGLGMAGVNNLGMQGEQLSGVVDAVDYISDLRQADDLSALPVGRNVVVIGGGMTAVDAAVQSRLLGAENVTMVYRRGKDAMNASDYEQQLAQTRGVKIIFSAQPVRLIEGEAGKIGAVEFEYTSQAGGALAGTGETFTLDADMVFKAIGQHFIAEPVNGDVDAITLKGGRIEVDENRRSNLEDVWAGGDCIAGGEDLTVAAVEDGKVAAEDINRYLGSVKG